MTIGPLWTRLELVEATRSSKRERCVLVLSALLLSAFSGCRSTLETAPPETVEFDKALPSAPPSAIGAYSIGGLPSSVQAPRPKTPDVVLDAGPPPQIGVPL